MHISVRVIFLTFMPFICFHRKILLILCCCIISHLRPQWLQTATVIDFDRESTIWSWMCHLCCMLSWIRGATWDDSRTWLTSGAVTEELRHNWVGGLGPSPDLFTSWAFLRACQLPPRQIFQETGCGNCSLWGLVTASLPQSQRPPSSGGGDFDPTSWREESQRMCDYL